MKISKIVASAGLSLAISGFAPCVFAQAPGGAGAPAAGMPGGGVMQQAPAEGRPGTQAPASAAPIGSASSDYMSNEDANAPANSSIKGPSAQNQETRARWWETKVQRDIVAARNNGTNVSKAQHQKWLGSEALSKGDQHGAIRHFELAERDLREGYSVSRNSVQYNRDNNLHANETDQPSNAVNMHSNRGANAAY